MWYEELSGESLEGSKGKGTLKKSHRTELYTTDPRMRPAVPHLCRRDVSVVHGRPDLGEARL